jgi:hypothetical protein
VAAESRRHLLACLLADPERARDQLAARLQEAWAALVAPFWVRIRTLLDLDIDERSRTLARHGLRCVLDGLYPKVRWTKRSLSLADAPAAPSRPTKARQQQHLGTRSPSG